MARVRESGMPAIGVWEEFFRPDEVINAFDIASTHRVLELGSGYGTFTLPLARRCRHVRTIDLDESLVQRLRNDRRLEGLPVECVVGDFFDPHIIHGSGATDVVVLFNILHMERPVGLLRTAARLLNRGGFVAIIHWRNDIDTPRGPPLEIRPSATSCIEWCRRAGFDTVERVVLAGAPYHFGIRASAGGVHRSGGTRPEPVTHQGQSDLRRDD